MYCLYAAIQSVAKAACAVAMSICPLQTHGFLSPWRSLVDFNFRPGALNL
jgi:hypothetical protein